MTVEESAHWYEEFTGHDADSVQCINFKVPKSVAIIGKLHAITYEAKRDNEIALYEHIFKSKNAPILAVSSDGAQLMVIGGNYEVTDHGIED